MPIISENKYLQSLLENLITSYETEINYSPIEIELDPLQITKKDIATLLMFVAQTRKRLFIFKLPGEELTTNTLAFTARRSVLKQTAETILESTSREPKINPLKQALSIPSSTVRAGIQIQKSFIVPKQPIILKDIQHEKIEHTATPDLVLIPVELPEFTVLAQQLGALGIGQLQDAAALKIKEHPSAFTDGIIPSNLPKGFYINKEKQALCYTDTPSRLPSALAPVLETPMLIALPSLEQAQTLLPATIEKITITKLLNTKNPMAQRNALISVLPTHVAEIKSFLQTLKPDESDYIVPVLAKMFIFGGEAHTSLFTRLLHTCLNKNLNIEFLKDPEAQNAFLNPRGIKNLQKLLQLPAEQKEWWNTLVIAHLKNDKHQFNFNNFFEAYTQIFLPRIAEKHLTLPNPCPIRHQGHLLITLNRVLEVLEHAENPQEQCLALTDLNWGPMGVHYAMTQKPESERFKQVASCMGIENHEDTITNPELIYKEIESETLNLKPWLFRYLGQHWKAEIRLTDIQARLDEIQNLLSWTPVQKNQLIFILTCTFSDKSPLNAGQWEQTLKSCIGLLEPLSKTERSDLLQALARCFQFIPNPSLTQIQTLIKQCLELKIALPTKNFKEELILPLFSCLEHEGFELFNTLQERIQKTDLAPTSGNLFSLTAIASFTTILQSNRQELHPDLIKLLAKLNEPDIKQTSITHLIAAFKNLQTKKDDAYYHLVLSTLSQINISKSQPLPDIQQIQALINALADLPDTIPVEHKTIDKQETWLKDLIIDKNLLTGCVLGNGDISKLDDLLVDALVDAIKKRSAALDIGALKISLQTNLQSRLVPDTLKEQINLELMPVFDAVNEIVILLQTPNPKFTDVIEKLRFFEEKKPALLNGIYSLTGLLGKSKGEYLVSFLLTGKRKEGDNITGRALSAILSGVHDLIIKQFNAFFANEQNKLIVKDLDAKTALSWMASFNETHSLTFFFKEELVQKKVLPALKKTLLQLNTQDPIFEKSILDAAADLPENEASDLSLQHYKNKIEGIAGYLNLLIDIKDKAPAQFNAIYKQLNTGALTRINYTQKQILISKLLQAKPESLDLYLKLTTQALEENPAADAIAIDRAISGLVTLFNLADLESETQIMFFKMSMAHNLKSSSPFPMGALSELKRSSLPEQTKSLIIKQIIQILSRMSHTDSPELIQELVQQTQTFLTNNPEQAQLCIALLKKISLEDPNHDLSVYPDILHQLALLSPGNRKKLATVLTGLANSKKDDTINLSALLEIAKGLGRRSSADIDQVLRLFGTPPYPITQNLNSALLAHGSEKLQAYCSSFDTNPFAKTGEKRDLAKHFATNRIQEALLSLQDLIHEVDLPHSLQLQLAKQLTYIETLGYTDPLNPNDFQGLKKLTARSRQELKERATTLLAQLRSKTHLPEQLELTQLELLANLREIYFRTTGLFPNTTQMLVLLLSLHEPSSNVLMRIKTGEGKSINTPMLSVLQWGQGGTVDQCTANPTLLIRDYENSCEPFFKFLDIKSALIQSNSPPEEYQLNGINCSTIEDMSIFRLATKESKKEALIQNDNPIHIVLDECDDALLDQTTLYKLVAKNDHSEAKENNSAQWIYPLAYQFINLPSFRNLNPSRGKVWDEDEDLEQFRLYLNKEINDKFNGNAEKQNLLMASSNTQLMQWIRASCKAATLVENKHFIVQPIKEKDDAGNETIKKIVCPLVRSTPKTGSIFTEGVQQALQARLIAERAAEAHYFVIDSDPPVLASQSARGLIKFYQKTKGRLLGISATPGDQMELKSLATLLGTRAVGVAPYAGDKRKEHPPVFTFSRQESIYSIHEAIDTIKHPIIKPTMEIDADAAIQTYEERETFIAQTKGALEQWSHTQTQPILIINEDFDEARTLGASFNRYKKEGFKIQIVTGKESPQELDRIIKQAGQANTITIGTAMLAKGIDINTGDHPRGLFVIQTYPDSERMTTQIAGRSARNGKPGEWLPVYQIKPPQSVFEKIMYYIFPWYRQSNKERAVEKLKTKIKLQATVDRLYTQAIDEAQQTLMQQIEAWESLLLELHPTDLKLQYVLYQWRETLLSELTRSQETSITQKTLESSVAQFKKAACKLWETAREEKWAAKAQKAAQLTVEQTLKFNYLKQLELTQEFNIQTTLQQKSKLFSAGAKALMHQNLETIIRDKAGVVLDYTTPEEREMNKLKLAQSKQLLPNLIGEFCAVYPEAIKKLIPQNTTQASSYMPEILRSLIDRVVEEKNRMLLGDEERRQITQTTIQFYQKELILVDSNKIQALLEQIKPLILAHSKILSKASLIDQFKMQGLVLTFNTLYQNSNLPEDAQLKALKTSYNDEIMKRLAEHLMNELDWVTQSPTPLHVLLERTVAREAAQAIHALAEDLSKSPKDAEKIHALYTGLQEHRLILQDKYLFSIGHNSPRDVINMALTAIDSLNVAPHCDRAFRDDCHDTVLAEHHLVQFRDNLEQMSLSFNHKKDPIWEHLKKTLIKMSEKSKNNQSYLFQELYEAIERFKTYEAYQPYLKQLNNLHKQLTQSLAALKEEKNGLKQGIQELLFKQKSTQLATLFNIDENQVRIQSGSNGIQSYIEVQVENAPLKEGFAGYQSSFFTTIESEKTRITQKKSILEANLDALLNLSNINAIAKTVPQAQQAEFEKLFRLKALLTQNWDDGFDKLVVKELPELTQSKLKDIAQLKQWNWTLEPVDLKQLNTIFAATSDTLFTAKIGNQTYLNKMLQEIQTRKIATTQQITDQKNKIAAEEASIEAKYARLQEPDCGRFEKLGLNTQILAHRATSAFFQRRLSGPKAVLTQINEELTSRQKELSGINETLDNKRKEFIAALIAQTKKTLNEHLCERSKKQVNEIQQDLTININALGSIQKTEEKKSRYQTRRFFTPQELLSYEAIVAQEETLIPTTKSV